jgi:hypothetical protein
MIKKTTLTLAIMLITAFSFAQTTIFPEGSSWKYYDSGNQPSNDGEGDNWKQVNFDDSGVDWTTGNAELGYGDSDEATEISNSTYTAYFRKSITATATEVAFATLDLNLTYDDGAVIYLNDVEIWAINMPAGRTYGTFASSDSGDNATASTSISNSLVLGNNVISVEVHQRTSGSSDISFDLELIGNPPLPTPTPTAEAIPADANWRYLDDGSNQGTGWRASAFDDSTWDFGLAELGYGDTQTTTVGYGGDPNNKYITTYFRKEFTIADHSIYNSIDLEAIRDDGMVVYLNGIEIWRDHISGTVDYTTLADSPEIGGSGETTWITNNIATTGLITGTNVIAVEIHQVLITSSDISFNFKLTPSAVPVGAPSIVRGPYLQSGTSTSAIVKWRTNNATDSKVNYGTSVGSLPLSVSDGTLTTEHELTLTGLTPNTKYFFNIANASVVYLPAESEMYVITAPTVGTEQFVRAWILGDAGTANQDQRDVRDAYYSYVDAASTNPGKTDMMLFLGDNAYNTGTDSEYQNALFDIYDDMLKKSVAWSCLGNHDGISANSNTQSGPYYDIFTFPKAGEAGGLASGTEAYYSFDYANIHFIVLDSNETNRDVDEPMYTWAQSDIQNTTQDWIVVLFHHPAYTMGSHNSDNETQLIEMRENFMPMLENHGVDLILSGHSHSYERSMFINGHNGSETTFNTNQTTSGGHIVGANGHLSGKADTPDGAYEKTNLDTKGAVYITTGSAGKATTKQAAWPHNAMYAPILELGSCVLEVEDDGSGNQNLTVKFIRETGVIDDYFTINKTGFTLSADTNESAQNSIKLFPVPAKDLLNIHVNLNERFKTAKFYNAIGKLVRESDKETINVSNMNTGMYIVEISTDKNTYYKSIIIE